MSELYPEVDDSLASRLLRQGIRIKARDREAVILPLLQEMGLVSFHEHRYIRCAYRDDDDFASREDLECPGRMEVQSPDREHYCPECGQPIVDISNKTVFVEYEIALEPEGIVKYLNSAFGALDSVSNVMKTSRFSFQADVGANTLNIVLPEYSAERALYQGIFFGESTLYITISPINQRELTVLEDLQHLALKDFLGKPRTHIEERVIQACVPIHGQRDLSQIETRFDEMLNRGWQYFEQRFVPALVQHISENPELCQSYLERLRRLNQTIFGYYHVPIGGSGKPDLISINRFQMMNQLLAGGFIGDAKCIPLSTLSYDDVLTINGHLDMEGGRAAVVFVAGESIASTAWDAAKRLRGGPNEPWKVMILSKYLLLELLSELNAQHLLELE